MNSPEFMRKVEIRKAMPCESIKRTLAELEADKWQDSWSFHTTQLDQWNDACGRAKKLQEVGWDVVLVESQEPAEKADGIAYLYKKWQE